MNRKNGNNSSIGTASHMERHYALPKNITSKRRSRNKCEQYEKETKICRHLGIACVGPSNELCRKYIEKAVKRSSIEVGSIVNDSRYGVGLVTRQFGVEFYEVRFCQEDILRKYNEKEIKKIILNPKTPK